MIQYTPKIDPDTVALYDFKNRITDLSPNGHHLTEDGTVSINRQSPASTTSNWNAGVFSAANYFSTPTALNTVLSSAGAYTIEFNLYLNSMANGPTVFDFPSTLGDTLHCFAQVTSAGTIRWWLRSSLLETAVVFTTGVWYHVALTYDGTDSKIYLDNSEIGTATRNGSLATINVGRIGRWNGGVGNEFVNGYINNFRISDIARTSFPTVDPRPEVH